MSSCMDFNNQLAEYEDAKDKLKSQSEYKYNKIVLCDLVGIFTKDDYSDCYILTGEDIEPELEVELTGAFFFNTEFKAVNRKTVATINGLDELKSWCKENSIDIPQQCLDEYGNIAVGGERDYIICSNLEPLGWRENVYLKDWLSQDFQAKNEILADFGVKSLNDIPHDKIISWVEEHEQLWEECCRKVLYDVDYTAVNYKTNKINDEVDITE